MPDFRQKATSFRDPADFAKNANKIIIGFQEECAIIDGAKDGIGKIQVSFQCRKTWNFYEEIFEGIFQRWD